MKKEYHLKYWGEVCNNDWIVRDLGIREKDFWFKSRKEQLAFRNRLQAVADSHNVFIAFAEYNGPDAHKRTVAIMTMILSDGRQFPYEMDFGYGYPKEGAEYIFIEGNYSCDCNRSTFLHEKYPEEVEKMDCGFTIFLKDFKVVQVADA